MRWRKPLSVTRAKPLILSSALLAPSSGKTLKTSRRSALQHKKAEAQV